MKRSIPALKSSTLVVRASSCCSMSAYWTIGPAISWGKQLTYSSSFQKLFCTPALPR